MSIFIENRRLGSDRIKKKYGQSCVILDTTSKSNSDFVKLSPFYPHGKIPVPFSEQVYSESVEGIWQGLKVFTNEGIDTAKFTVSNMKGLKRNSKKFGNILGHRKGIHSVEILDYVSAKKLIYIPSYVWVLKHYLSDIVVELSNISRRSDLVLLDYNVSDDLFSPRKPISHAYLCKKYIEDNNYLDRFERD